MKLYRSLIITTLIISSASAMDKGKAPTPQFTLGSPRDGNIEILMLTPQASPRSTTSMKSVNLNSQTSTPISTPIVTPVTTPATTPRPVIAAQNVPNDKINPLVRLLYAATLPLVGGQIALGAALMKATDNLDHQGSWEASFASWKYAIGWNGKNDFYNEAYQIQADSAARYRKAADSLVPDPERIKILKELKKAQDKHKQAKADKKFATNNMWQAEKRVAMDSSKVDRLEMEIEELKKQLQQAALQKEIFPYPYSSSTASGSSSSSTLPPTPKMSGDDIKSLSNNDFLKDVLKLNLPKK
jgi:hypothetical protein